MAASKKKKKSSSALKSLIIVIIMAALLVLAYVRVLNAPKKNSNNEEYVAASAVQEILLRDMDRMYPPSPKEVIKYYSDLTKCLYNEDCSDEEIELLAKRALLLYDDELAANQEWNRYITNLKSEIATKKSQSYAIMNYSLSASTDVVFFEKDQYECASLYCKYNIRNGSVPGSVEELFILRKDENGHWRILGWELSPDSETAEGLAFNG